ncbi:hypothetical protein [Alcanivorax jadensis]|uniref:hypothetical protein n=1 Tax=Alcanivorax jadensis TaxID=64988 RepID=UPI0023556203|nr:hypothetical protein [Alcanivorax jadensis]|tara:strand:- start:444 stop:611 length:168 start_codon:yes stop_codon:yes gene_type:complete
MASYRLKEKAYINGSLKKPGAVVELELPKGDIPSHLEPVKEPPKGQAKPAGDGAK